MSLKAKLAKIDQELDGALASGKLKLIAVSKYAEDEQVIEAYQAGQKIFGENYVLPGLRRKERLKLADTEWHLIGPLQKNKINKAVGNFDLIHSVHSLEIAELINKRAEQLGIRQKILLQVNSTGDKSGFGFEEIPGIIESILNFSNIDLQGLMTMGPHKISEKSETIYQRMRLLKEEMKQAFSFGVFELSMGMSNDYLLAAQNGSTMIRIGRELFSD